MEERRTGRVGCMGECDEGERSGQGWMDGGVGRAKEKGVGLDGWRGEMREREGGGAGWMEEWDEGRGMGRGCADAGVM